MDNGEETKIQAEPTISIVEEARKIRDEILRQKEELKAENDRREKLISESLLSGTTGGRVEPVVKVDTPKEYAEKVMRGEIKVK